MKDDTTNDMSYEQMRGMILEVRKMTMLQMKKKNLDKISFGKRAVIVAYLQPDYDGIKYYEDLLWGKT